MATTQTLAPKKTIKIIKKAEPVPIVINPNWDDEDLKNIQFFVEKCIHWANTTKRFSLEKKTILIDMARFFYTYLYTYNHKGRHWGTDGDPLAAMCFKIRHINNLTPYGGAQFKLAKELFKLWESPEHFLITEVSTQCDWPSLYQAKLNPTHHPKLWAKSSMANIVEYYMANWCSAFHSTRWKKN